MIRFIASEAKAAKRHASGVLRLGEATNFPNATFRGGALRQCVRLPCAGLWRP